MNIAKALELFVTGAMLLSDAECFLHELLVIGTFIND
jgi:hypothetical protein